MPPLKVSTHKEGVTFFAIDSYFHVERNVTFESDSFRNMRTE